MDWYRLSHLRIDKKWTEMLTSNLKKMEMNHKSTGKRGDCNDKFILFWKKVKWKMIVSLGRICVLVKIWCNRKP